MFKFFRDKFLSHKEFSLDAFREEILTARKNAREQDNPNILKAAVLKGAQQVQSISSTNPPENLAGAISILAAGFREILTYKNFFLLPEEKEERILIGLSEVTSLIAVISNLITKSQEANSPLTLVCVDMCSGQKSLCNPEQLSSWINSESPMLQSFTMAKRLDNGFHVEPMLRRGLQGTDIVGAQKIVIAESPSIPTSANLGLQNTA